MATRNIETGAFDADLVKHFSLLPDLKHRCYFDPETQESNGGLVSLGHCVPARKLCAQVDDRFSALFVKFPRLLSRNVGHTLLQQFIQHTIATIIDLSASAHFRRLASDKLLTIKRECEHVMLLRITQTSKISWSSPLHNGSEFSAEHVAPVRGQPCLEQMEWAIFCSTRHF